MEKAICEMSTQEICEELKRISLRSHDLPMEKKERVWLMTRYESLRFELREREFADR
jgi:hypothetical protein